ncbi:hypothetical protein BB560_003436 [Smittium megazygosporum]|uniref:Peptide hydrolase n=1 Tax=Smittium megazygosporum TaxID=133381 RepID=A0A2T9ZC42_9FUNG|nr:hypothetical protein BB560_003436 [Smittium megazygosporum]
MLLKTSLLCSLLLLSSFPDAEASKQKYLGSDLSQNDFIRQKADFSYGRHGQNSRYLEKLYNKAKKGIASKSSHFKSFSSKISSIDASFDFYSKNRMIQTAPNTPPVSLSQKEINSLRRMGIKFMDVTDFAEHVSVSSTKPFEPFPKDLNREKYVKALIPKLSTNFTSATLTKFTSFTTRYFNSVFGKDAALWLKDQIASLIALAPEKDVISVRTFDHSFQQPSVIARFEGSGDDKAKVIIITAHLDSINSWVPWFGRAPGADDNGSGTVTILDAFRVLALSGFKPSKSVEFHWYAGEEGGLLGSQDVAKHYKDNEINMLGQLHFDMTGYFEGDEIYGLVADNIDNDMLEYLTLLVKGYTRLEPAHLKCGYACSDHASWNKYGYRSTMSYESDSLTQNKNIHTPRDTVETISFDHILEFSKVALAYSIEFGL